MSQLNVPLILKCESCGKKAEIKEPRRSSRPHKPNPCYIQVAVFLTLANGTIGLLAILNHQEL